MIIRRFEHRDYPAIVDIHNSLNIVWPAWSREPKVWEETDRNRAPKCFYQRWVAEEDGQLIGAASCGNRLDDFHPQKFYVNIEVLEEYRNRGIGGMLYKQLMEVLDPRHPKILRTDILENQIQSYPFMQRRGFREVWRETPVHISVEGFDLSPYRRLEEDLKSDGLLITNLEALKDDPQRNRKIFDLYDRLSRDVPSEFEEYTPIVYEDWAKMILEDPGADPSTFLVVVDGDKYIALHDLWIDTQAREMLGGLLGTLPDYRGKRIGMALIVRAIALAQERSLSVFKTCTAKVNAPMQKLFTRLGFARDPEWLQCQKDLD